MRSVSSDATRTRFAPDAPDAVDALICGAGPVGLLLANLLGARGCRVAVIDKRTNASTIPRAIGLCEEGSRSLHHAGLLDDFADRTRTLEAVDFVRGGDRRLLSFDVEGTLNGYPRLRMFFQPELEAHLRRGLARFPGVATYSGCALIDFEDRGDGVVCRVETGGEADARREREVRARFLFGCDGANSTVRGQLGIAMQGDTYAEPWLIIDTDRNPHPDHKALFFCDPERPGVTMSGPGTRRRFEFLMRDGEREDAVLSDAFLAPLLAPWGRLEALEIARRTVYTFEARVAERFRVGNVFLLGDAAHLTPPFLGQGLMAGFRDAVNLAWKVAGVLDGQLGDAVLESYHRERRPHAAQLVTLAKGLGAFILPQRRVSAWLRDRIAGAIRRIRRGAPVRIRKTPNHIRGGALASLVRTRADRVGFEFPQYPLHDAAGRPARIDDLLMGHFTLVSYGDPVAPFGDAELAERWKALGGRSVSIAPASRGGPGPEWVDLEGRYAALFRGGARVVVVRPDLIVLANVRRTRLESVLPTVLPEIPTARVPSPTDRPGALGHLHRS